MKNGARQMTFAGPRVTEEKESVAGLFRLFPTAHEPAGEVQRALLVFRLGQKVRECFGAVFGRDAGAP